MPETSIVIRTFNEEKHLGNLLRAIISQNYKNYEIILVDSGSTDKTLEIAREFPVKIIKIESRDFTFGYSLNIGCKHSRGKYLVFASAHAVPVDERWLSNVIAPFRNEKVAMVYGKQMGHHKSKFSEMRDFQKMFGESALDSKVFLDYANNANSAIRKKLWEERPFDEYLFGLEDIDWAKDMTKRGYLVHYEPKAVIYHIHTEEWHQVFNRYRREAIAAVRIGLKHPPQARLEFHWMISRLIGDIIKSFPNLSPSRLEEILRFRYYQWKGSRQGWFRDKDLDLNRDKVSLMYSPTNEAVVIKDKRDAVIEKIHLPEMKPGDVLIQTAFVGVCKTDIEVYEGSLGYYKTGQAKYPIVPGHEFSGTIVKIGANNKYRERFKVGERVVSECILSRDNDNRKEIGVINYNGAYSQLVIVPGDAIHRIPNGLDLKTAVMTEPLALVLRALGRLEGRLLPNSLVAVVGAGQIGNLSTQVLSLDGYQVSVYDKNVERLTLLEGKAREVNTIIGDIDKFDVIIEATGSKEVLEQILRESRVDSTILLLGFPYGVTKYNFEDIVGKEKVVIGSVGADDEEFTRALKLLPKLDTAPFIQNIFPLQDFRRAWDDHRSSKYLKILLQP